MLCEWFDEELDIGGLRQGSPAMPLTIIPMDTLESIRTLPKRWAFSFLDFTEYCAREIRKDEDIAAEDSQTLLLRFLSERDIPWRANPRTQKLFGDFMENFRWREGVRNE